MGDISRKLPRGLWVSWTLSQIYSRKCRKPDSLLFEKALARFDIDPAQSWMIGDSERDIMAAEKAGMKTILISPNEDIRKYSYHIIQGGSIPQ